ncbi:hypothetical protein RND71_029852 [Anisodus tanguticus]|uniref:KNOX2 domain-containing protein n=1 Tax=Anisodus tanguticus TaxID=243964 RepID=A0AAE1RG15_9SOLA|nr:hypothetical protein RND71_029852 [Anisodus tanguticus]
MKKDPSIILNSSALMVTFFFNSPNAAINSSSSSIRISSICSFHQNPPSLLSTFLLKIPQIIDYCSSGYGEGYGEEDIVGNGRYCFLTNDIVSSAITAFPIAKTAHKYWYLRLRDDETGPSAPHHQVGAPPEIVNMLDNIVQENDFHRRSSSSSGTALNRPISDDSDLDDFMVTYCDVLAKFKLDLARSFNEGTTFLKDIQTQLTNLCITTNISGLSLSFSLSIHACVNYSSLFIGMLFSTKARGLAGQITT